MPDSSAASYLIPHINALTGPWWLLALLLYVTFVIHLLLVNAVVGVSFITLVPRLRVIITGKSGKAPDVYAPDVLLPKGVAFVVNFGIPPFLFMQAIYPQFIYSSSVIMGLWWLSVMLVVMLAYYGLYINMSRKELSENFRTFALTVATILLLWNAFLFVNNITLLQHPERWVGYAQNASGSFLNVGDTQVIPRYLHIIIASIAVGGLTIALPSHFKLRQKDLTEQERARYAYKKQHGINWFFYATLLQVVVGLWFLISLPGPQRSLFIGGSILHTALLITGPVLAILSLAAAYKKKLMLAIACAGGVVLIMTVMRTLLRSAMIEPYYEPLMRKTEFGPLLMFIGSVVIFGPVMYWSVRLYLRSEDAESLIKADPVNQTAGSGDLQERGKEEGHDTPDSTAGLGNESEADKVVGGVEPHLDEGDVDGGQARFRDRAYGGTDAGMPRQKAGRTGYDAGYDEGRHSAAPEPDYPTGTDRKRTVGATGRGATQQREYDERMTEGTETAGDAASTQDAGNVRFTGEADVIVYRQSREEALIFVNEISYLDDDEDAPATGPERRPDKSRGNGQGGQS